MSETISLSKLTGKKTINNPADMLPKKKVVLKDSTTEALGDLGLVIQKENQETEKIANAMIEDMKRAKAMGKQPQFRTDELATEGMQPMQINYDLHSTEGIDTNIPLGKDVQPSNALDLDSTSSIQNYIKPPIYTNSCNVFTDPIKIIDADSVDGPRSVLADNNQIDHHKINTTPQPVQQQSNEVVSDEVDPDDDADIMALLAQEFGE